MIGDDEPFDVLDEEKGPSGWDWPILEATRESRRLNPGSWCNG
jgi:hypothetical protein